MYLASRAHGMCQARYAGHAGYLWARIGAHLTSATLARASRCGHHRRLEELGHKGEVEQSTVSRRPLEGAPAIARHTAKSVRATRRARDGRQRHSSSISPMKVTKSVTRRKRTRGLLREATLRLVLCTNSGTRSRPAACHVRIRSMAHYRERGATRRRRQGAVGHARKLVGS